MTEEISEMYYEHVFNMYSKLQHANYDDGESYWMQLSHYMRDGWLDPQPAEPGSVPSLEPFTMMALRSQNYHHKWLSLLEPFIGRHITGYATIASIELASEICQLSPDEKERVKVDGVAWSMLDWVKSHTVARNDAFRLITLLETFRNEQGMWLLNLPDMPVRDLLSSSSSDLRKHSINSSEKSFPSFIIDVPGDLPSRLALDIYWAHAENEVHAYNRFMREQEREKNMASLEIPQSILSYIYLLQFQYNVQRWIASFVRYSLVVVEMTS